MVEFTLNNEFMNELTCINNCNPRNVSPIAANEHRNIQTRIK